MGNLRVIAGGELCAICHNKTVQSMKNFIDVTAAILIMGFVFWVITRMEIAWRKRSSHKNSEGIEKDRQTLSTEDKPAFFWKHKRVLIIGIVIVVLLIVWWLYNSQKKNELNCLQRIEYRAGSANYYRIDGSENRRFKTQTEAMNYCLKVLRPR